jgi:hypothetical protein
VITAGVWSAKWLGWHMIRRYVTWGSNHACDERLRRIVDRANIA